MWAGSIEVGVTSHDPENIVLPPTMTSMTSGTWMLSGRSVIVNGQEAKRDYTSINLETLKVHKSLHNIDCKKYVFVRLSVNCRGAWRKALRRLERVFSCTRE